MILARSSSVKQSTSKSLALLFTPRSSTPWLRTSRKPSSKILFATFATSGVIWRALFTCVCSAPDYAAGGKSGKENFRTWLPRRSQPGRAAARRKHQRQRFARTLLHAARSRQNHAVLLLHVRHDSQFRALAFVHPGSPAVAARHHGVLARLCHAADDLRCALCRQALGSSSERLRPRKRHLLLDQELSYRH